MRNGTDIRRLADFAEALTLLSLGSYDLDDVFKRYGPFDAVIHTSTSYGLRGEGASEMIECNLTMPLQLLELAKRFRTNVFYNTDTVLPPQLNPYALTKMQFVQWGLQICKDAEMRFVNIRLEHIYGQFDSLDRFTSRIVLQCMNNVPEIRLTRGEQLLDFIYIDDVVDAYLCLLDHINELPLHFVELGLGTGAPISLKFFVESVHRQTNSTSNLCFGAVPYRPHELMYSSADLTQLSQIGWKARTSLNEGISKILMAME